MKDRWGAYREEEVLVEPVRGGSLDGLTFAVKDVFDVQGSIAGAGNPDWERSHKPATRHAEAIRLLLNQGARLAGTTHTDELMYSLNGENYHYGTPINPRAPRRIPGGSSSGSAVAVAAGRVDFALGTDTGGSVRIPSSYCGIYGFRPTHGRVAMEGVIPLAPSFDTVGWMSDELHILGRVAEVLLGERQAAKGARDVHEKGRFQRLLVGMESMGTIDEETRATLRPLVEQMSECSGLATMEVSTAPEGLEVWMRTFRWLQGMEIWRTHKDWIEREQPCFGPGIAERFAWCRTLEGRDASEEVELRKHVQEQLQSLLGFDGVMILPTAPGPAPLRGSAGELLEDHRSRTMQLSCIAGLAGLPQLTLPWAMVEGAPVGISLIAGLDQDVPLLSFAAELAERMGRGHGAVRR